MMNPFFDLEAYKKQKHIKCVNAILDGIFKEIFRHESLHTAWWKKSAAQRSKIKEACREIVEEVLNGE